ncbi:MAG: potassium transporter TrkG, partial [Eubacterium sp.]
LIINLSAVLLITLDIMKLYGNINDAIRDSFFAVNTVMSTTGFCTADFNIWPTFSKTLLVILMLIGCSAGSTGGGIKVTRVVLYVKQVSRDFKQMLHPHEVVNVRMNNRVVDGHIMKGVNSYLTIYIITLIVSTVLVSLDSFDIVTTFTAVVSCFNNIGPGLEVVGPTGNYVDFSIFSKLVLIFDMLAGRLELFPILLLLSPNTWKKA